MTKDDLCKYDLRKGDLLVCEGGEVGRAAIWDAPISDCYFQKTLHRIRLKDGSQLDLSYLLVLLYRYANIGFYDAYVTKTSIAHLPKDKMEALPLVLPPLPEQRKIAAALSDVDEMIAALEKLIEKKRKIKTGAMQRFLTGKTRLPGFNDAWVEKRLGEMGSWGKGAGISRSEAQSGRLPAVRYGEIYTTHNDYIKKFESFISDDVARQSTRMKNGDIVFAGSGETKEEIGKCVAFLGDEEAYAGGDLIVLSPESQYDSKFLGFVLNSSAGVAQKSAAGQGDAVVHIRTESLAAVVVRLPPTLAEQKAIAKVLGDMDEEIAALEAELAKTRRLKQGMMQELLTGRVRLVEAVSRGERRERGD